MVRNAPCAQSFFAMHAILLCGYCTQQMLIYYDILQYIHRDLFYLKDTNVPSPLSSTTLTVIYSSLALKITYHLCGEQRMVKGWAPSMVTRVLFGI